MKTLKHVLTLALCLALICAVLPHLALQAHAVELSGYCGADGDNLAWTLDMDTGALTISGSGAMKNYKTGESIWNAYREIITSVSFPAGMTSIGDNAFCNCASLKSVTAREGLTRVGKYAFAGCTGLTSLSLPEGLTEIEKLAFANCSGLTSLVLPEGVKDVGNGAFYGCSGLTEISFPESLRTVGSMAFGNCTGLTSVTIPSGVDEIEEGAFGYYFTNVEEYEYAKVEGFTIYGTLPSAAWMYARQNEFPFVVIETLDALSGQCGAEGDELTWTLDVESGLLTITGSGRMQDFPRRAPWINYRELITEISLPSGLQNIGGRAFEGCAIEQITLPAGLTEIGPESFLGCEALQSIPFPESLTTIGVSAFSGCSKLTELPFPAGLTTIDEFAFNSCDGLTSVVLPAGLTVLARGVFANCDDLESVSLPEGLTSVEAFAFYGCRALREISLPEGLTTIERNAFTDCYALRDLVLPESLRVVKEQAFYDCPDLTSVTIPYGVEEIGCEAFGYVWDSELQNETTLDGFTIYGVAGTAAQRYAAENQIQFVPVKYFLDVHEDDFFFNPVLWAVENGVTGGVDETHFAPERTVMRADAMVFFWAAKDRPSHSIEQSPFQDVKKKHWYYDAVMWAVENGVTGGTDATHFSPKNTCSRSEILQFLYAAMGKPEYTISNPYSDVKTKHWYCDGAIWAYEKGLEKGENGKFQAKTPCTRGYVVTYLYRFMTGNELAQ